jgi:sigma-B regulation protein RsbU (phosphoserine phosphatase)
VEVERERARLSTELTLAHDLQLALLPAQALLAKSGDIGARSQPAEFVGGDFYDLISLRRDVVGVMMGDVSGHGISAAMLMAHAMSAAGILAQSAPSPEDALMRLLDAIGDELRRSEMSMALFYGVVDRRKSTLRYANAGHPHAFVVPGDGGTPVRLAATAPPLGLAGENIVLGAQVAWRAKTDILCLFTDGMVDTRDAAGGFYGEERLLDVVRANATRPAPEIVDAVFADIETFSGDGHDDDRSLFVLRR